MTVATRVITAHIPSALADRVDVVAAQSERSREWIVKQALAAWVDQEEERHRLTLEALLEVTSGQVIDHASVRAWADSLSIGSPLPPPGI